MIIGPMGGGTGILHSPHHNGYPRTQRGLGSIHQDKQQGLWRLFCWLWWLKPKKQRERKSVLVHEIYPTKLLLIFFVVSPEGGMSGNGCWTRHYFRACDPDWRSPGHLAHSTLHTSPPSLPFFSCHFPFFLPFLLSSFFLHCNLLSSEPLSAFSLPTPETGFLVALDYLELWRPSTSVMESIPS